MDRKQLIFLTALFLFLAWLPVQAKEFKIATVAPDGSSWMQEMRRGAGEIAERTQDRVTLKFYPGGIMGDEKNVLRKIRIGQLHGAALTTLGLARIFPALSRSREVEVSSWQRVATFAVRDNGRTYMPTRPTRPPATTRWCLASTTICSGWARRAPRGSSTDT